MAFTMRPRRQRTQSITLDIQASEALRASLMQELNAVNEVVDNEHRARRAFVQQELHEWKVAFDDWRERRDRLQYQEERRKQSSLEHAVQVTRYFTLLKSNRENRSKVREVRWHEKMQPLIEETMRFKHENKHELDVQQKRKTNHLQRRRAEILQERQEIREKAAAAAQRVLDGKQRKRQDMQHLLEQEKNERVVKNSQVLRSRRKLVHDLRSSHVSPATFLQLPPIRDMVKDVVSSPTASYGYADRFSLSMSLPPLVAVAAATSTADDNAVSPTEASQGL